MLDVFEFQDYREFVRQWIRQKPKGGHGQYRKMATFLRIIPVTISLVFKGERELPLEAALPLGDFLGLGSLQKKYFLKLVALSHAGTAALKNHILDEIEKLKSESQDLKSRVPTEVQLLPSDLGIFHSSWVYSTVRLLTAIDGYQTLDSIAAKLDFSIQRTEEVLSFLVSCGLCHRAGDQFKLGPSRTYLPKDSAFIIPRQITWRSRATMQMHKQLANDFYYTAPMVISNTDVAVIRKELFQLVERVHAVVEPSQPQELYCLNMDWFKVI